MIFVFLFLTYFTLYDTLSVHPHLSNDPISFLFMAEIYSIVYMYHIFFIHSSVDKHLGSFQVLAIAKSAAMYPFEL